MKYYAGIGSRKTPENILKKIKQYSYILNKKNYKLRSGGAIGADKAFELGAGINKEIFYAKDAQKWAYEEAKRCLPRDVVPEMFNGWKPYVQSLLARNMMQVLGLDGNDPVEFVLCWAPSLNYMTREVGGTGYAMRCAMAHGIRFYNLFSEEQTKAFEDNFNINI